MRTFIHSLIENKIINYLKSLFFLLLIAFLTAQAFAQPANIIIHPASATFGVGSNFAVSVKVDFTGTTSPAGADETEVHLSFDPAKLRVVSISKPSTLTTETIPLAPLATINTSGQIDYHAGTTIDIPTADFNFLDITFEVVGGNGTSTSLTCLPPTNVSRAGGSILNSVVNGIITISGAACTPPVVTISGTAVCIGGDITLNLANSSAGTGPFDLTINGTTYNDIATGDPVLPAPFTAPRQTIFPGNPIPAPADKTLNDVGLFGPIASTIEVGMRFRSSVDGFVKGVRFYNGLNNAGTYTGKLYTSDGIELASIIFTGVTADAWQEVTFTTPVFITADTTYVVTYFSSLGYYAQAEFIFNAPVISGPLTGLASDGTETGGNGLFLYGGGFPGKATNFPTFPNTYNNTSYFVDVIFTPSLSVFNLTSVTDASGCTNTGAPQQVLPVTSTIPRVTISGKAACDGGGITLNLESSSNGTGPFDLTINGVTYNGVAVGNPIFPEPFRVPTQSVFPGNPIPAPADKTLNDVGTEGPVAGSIEVGMRFRTSVDGFVKGVRFYNGLNNAGNYTGKLYTGTGMLLSGVVFTGVTTDAWQEANFTAPVFISADSTYVVTYFSSLGYYASIPSVFDEAVSGGFLTGLASDDTEAGGNGVFLYGEGFPGTAANFPPYPNTYSNTSYLVDVNFIPASTTFNLTSLTDALGCTNSSGALNLQTLTVTSADCGALPVVLINFYATPQGNKITLYWMTAYEINNRGFDIERSVDSVNWTTIGFVTGAGNSSVIKDYTYADANLEARRYYYRLKQIYFDESFNYSAIVSATLTGEGEYVLKQNYPNPTNGKTIIQFILPKAEKVNLSLFDISGRVVKVLVNGLKDKGTHTIPFNVGSLARGIYYYRIQAGNFTDVKKLAIQ